MVQNYSIKIIFQVLKLKTCAFLQGIIVSSSSHIDQNRDLAADVKFAQSKLSAYIQQCVHFSSTYQIILNSDIKIEIFNIFQQIYLLLEQLQVWIRRLNKYFFILQTLFGFRLVKQ